MLVDKLVQLENVGMCFINCRIAFEINISGESSVDKNIYIPKHMVIASICTSGDARRSKIARMSSTPAHNHEY